ADVRAMDVSPLDANLLDAVVRLVRLLDSPAEAQVLMPLITREIIYRLLVGEQGARLRHLAVLGGYTPDIARAVERLRQDFDQPLRRPTDARHTTAAARGPGKRWRWRWPVSRREPRIPRTLPDWQKEPDS